MSAPASQSNPPGHLYGVGVGPGDPDLMTVKALRALQSCDVVAHFAARSRPGNAWTTISQVVTAAQSVVRLEYPVTTEAIDRDDYERRIAAFYDRSADELAAHLDAGRNVAVVCEGDPFFYGSYMYIHQRLADRYPTSVIPGVTSFSAATAAAGVPLVSMNETLTVLPGVLPADQLDDVVATADAAVIMKVGRRLDGVRNAVEAADRTADALYVERASCPEQRVLSLADTGEVTAPYFSLVLLPGRGLGIRHRAVP